MLKVLVTGATGFLAQYIIKNFIDEGYEVVGTVRSEAKGIKLLTSFPEGFSFVVIENLDNYEQVSSAISKISDLKYFIHTAASLNIFSQDSEKDILIPNINATKVILKVLKESSPKLEKFVFTSSISAFNTDVMGFDPINEESWSTVTYEQGKLNGFLGYPASKKLCEKEIFKFLEEELPSFSAVTIGVSMILGIPFVRGEELNGSARLLLRSLKAESEKQVEPLDFLTINVEDVAKSHFIAATNPKISNERLLISANRLTQQDVLDAGNEFEELKGKIPKGTPRTVPIKLETNVDNKKTISLLGFKPDLTTKNLQKVIQYIIDEKNYL